ncbi:hypothetical protein SteCoe_11560 [Stentor coeruleus]|uniref:Cache domain-containing protein n=1 Tax=Stentor coeruleus TaxID=5963 RepID=A0A1R2CCW6_9CILI|nr:hypothetical protein SteCoe_11560 [Stentor coeruleus]
MGLLNEYSLWPLGRQLQATFITTSIILSAIIVIITKFQLDWLHDKMISKSTSVLEGNLIEEMRNLGEREALYVSTYLGFTSSKLLDYTESTRVVLGYSNIKNPIDTDKDLTESSKLEGLGYDFNTFAYFSKNTLSNQGQTIVESLKPLNEMFPILYSTISESVFLGFYTDELYCMFPGVYVSDLTYSPLVREWFYKATSSPGKIMITEPYINSETSIWKIALSTAIIDKNNNTLGAMAIEIMLDDFKARFSNIAILKTGFIMLISSGGMILTTPSTWSSSFTLRIYDETNTGISQTQWEKMKSLDDGTKHNLKDANGTEYIGILYKVCPTYNLTSITHYILLMGNISDIQDPLDDLDTSYNKMYTVIFWFVLSIAAIVLLITLVLIYFESKTASFQLKLVDKVFDKIIRRALFPKMTKGISFTKLESNNKGIEKLVDNTKEYIEKLKSCEEKFSVFQWGLTRPSDICEFSKWQNVVYPFNMMNDKKMQWRRTFTHLEKILSPE